MSKAKSRRKKGAVRNLIAISDLHSGCQLALYPPGGVKLDEGGSYSISPFQRKLWRYWEIFWDEWVPKVTQGEPYLLLVNGDAMDGTHHGATTQITHNLNDQQKIAEAILEPVIARPQCRGYFHTRGTEAHVGPSGEREEALAEALGAIPNDEGQYARYDLWLNVGGALVHALHHIGTTGTTHYALTAPLKELGEIQGEAARWEVQPPDFLIRSHRHRCVVGWLRSKRGRSTVCVTPGWQGKTPFAWRIAGARITTPQFGGVCVRDGDEEMYLREQVWTVSRSKTEEVRT